MQNSKVFAHQHDGDNFSDNAMKVHSRKACSGLSTTPDIEKIKDKKEKPGSKVHTCNPTTLEAGQSITKSLRTA